LIGDAGGVLGLGRPVAAEGLEGVPAQQDGVAGSAVALHVLVHVRWVVGGIEPVIEHLDRPVGGYVLGDHQGSHGVSSARVNVNAMNIGVNTVNFREGWVKSGDLVAPVPSRRSALRTGGGSAGAEPRQRAELRVAAGGHPPGG